MKLSLRLIFILSLILPLSAAWADRIKDIATSRRRTHQSACRLWFGGGLVWDRRQQLGHHIAIHAGDAVPFWDVDGSSGTFWHQCSAVMVTADLLPFMKPVKLDVTVSALGGASSLRGGTLLMTPLLGADGQTYAIARETLRLEALV